MVGVADEVVVPVRGVRRLFVSVCVSVSPTTVPEGAVLADQLASVELLCTAHAEPEETNIAHALAARVIYVVVSVESLTITLLDAPAL